MLVRLGHEVLTGAHPGPELVLRPDAPAVVPHPLHPVLSERQIEVRRQAGRLTTVHGIVVRSRQLGGDDPPHNVEMLYQKLYSRENTSMSR